MRRSILAVLMLVTVLFTSSVAHADWHSFWARVKLDIQRNNAFPEPFASYDRIAVKAPWKTMAAKGTQQQNTLGAHHFDHKTNKLTPAGQAKLEAILARHHVARDTVFVLQGMSQDITATRVATVRNAMVVTRPGRSLPAVLETDLPAGRWAGVNVHAVNQGFVSAIPAPILPAASSGLSQ